MPLMFLDGTDKSDKSDYSHPHYVQNHFFPLGGFLIIEQTWKTSGF